MVVAVALASVSKSSAGTTRETRPLRSASAASMVRPVRMRSIALALPIARVSRWEPPMPGSTPSFISGCPNFAVSAAISTSHIIASSQPPPSAYPATAAIVGVRTAASLPQVAKKSAVNASANVRSAISLMSAPAANALAEPVMMIAPMSGSSSSSVAALVTSFITWLLSAFSAWGRFSVIMPTR
ncbi:Uncharacterised protein [Mycobacterium tuberculosis]|nr:Uncharacterised protein [Mycobacterium tuberculosis]